MADTYEEYRLAGFAVIFSLLVATVFGLIGMSDHVPTPEEPDISIFEGIGEFFRNDNFDGWEKFFYTVVLLSPMLTVGTMIFLNWGRGR